MASILHLDSSARGDASLTREASQALASKLATQNQATVTHREIDNATPLLTEQMVASYFTSPAERTSEQQQVIAASDAVVDDLRNHDIYVVGLPMYNFAMPAAFKAWADLAARVGETFKYTENGPVGLLEDKQVHIVVTSGGTQLGSEIDFLTPWVRQFFKFIGVERCEIVSATEVLAESNETQAAA